MSDDLLTGLALLVELGIPLALIIAINRIPRLRSRAVVILGAVTPLLCLYGWSVAGFVHDPRSQGATFAFYAGPGMTLGFFLASLVVGILLSTISRPINLWARFFLSSVLTPAMVLGTAYGLQNLVG